MCKRMYHRKKIELQAPIRLDNLNPAGDHYYLKIFKYMYWILLVTLRLIISQCLEVKKEQVPDLTHN